MKELIEKIESYELLNKKALDDIWLTDDINDRNVKLCGLVGVYIAELNIIKIGLQCLKGTI